MYVHKCWTFRIYIHLLYFTSVFMACSGSPQNRDFGFHGFQKLLIDFPYCGGQLSRVNKVGHFDAIPIRREPR